MVDLAITILAVIVGFIAAVASYPELDVYVLAIVAFFGAVAVGILAGALFYAIAKWVYASVKRATRV